jgi:hypothetical protein
MSGFQVTSAGMYFSRNEFRDQKAKLATELV